MDKATEIKVQVNGWVFRTFRYFWIKLLRLRGEPQTLARGIGIGVFVALTPTVPLHTILIMALCTLLRGQILAGLIASFIVSNPFTMVIHYYGAWKIGVLLTGSSISWNEIQHIVHIARSAGFLKAMRIISGAGADMLTTMLLGGVVFALPFGIASYAAAFYIYTARQRKRIKGYLNSSDATNSGPDAAKDGD